MADYRGQHVWWPPRYIKGLTDEERERRADGLFTEFLSSNDEKEAVLCAHELAVRLRPC